MTSTHRSAHRVGVIPGDGIGPEVVGEGVRILERVAQLTGFAYELEFYPWSSEHYLRTRELMPESIIDEYRALDALYLGALGDPRVERGLVERAVIMTIRLGLDLYINLRPVVLYAEHLCPLKDVRASQVDMVVVRENTEDCYVGLGGVMRAGTPDEIAIAEMVYTRRGVERAVTYAFELARSRGKQHRVTLVDKANAIRAQEIWRRTFADVASAYPDIECHELYVDAAAMSMVIEPDRFDVIVTTNLFGDILTDLGATLQGGVGSAASGNLHPGQVSMFEPIHGSAPAIAGQNCASPIGAILALALMLDYLGEKVAADLVESAVANLLRSRTIPGVHAKSGISTRHAGDLVIREIERLATELPA